jgi:aryl-alcohol dehydrogenase
MAVEVIESALGARQVEILAAVARAPGAPMSLETLELDAPRDDEVLVRIVSAGICHTDLVARDQILPVPQPVVLGHEGAGVVEEVGRSVTKVAPGDHVLLTFSSCGRCPTCIEGQATYCHRFLERNLLAARPDGSTSLARNGEAIHGRFFGQSSFATYALGEERNVVRVPREAPLEVLAPLACGVQTGAGAVLNALELPAGASFAVFGSGSVGLSAILAARLAGAATIVAVDVDDARLAVARELGATHTVNSTRENPTEAILALSGTGVQFALDTTGLAGVIREAVESLAPRGTCGIVGASPPGSEIVLDEVHFMSAGRRLYGIVEGDSKPDAFIPRLVELYLKGRFPFDRMVRFYPFEQINDAIRDSESLVAIKPVLRMPSLARRPARHGSRALA